MKLNIGLIYVNNKLKNHRSLLKIIFNPLLRLIGYNIGSLINYNDHEGKIKRIILIKCEYKFNIFKNLKESWI